MDISISDPARQALPTSNSDDTRWRAIAERDRRADGTFVFGVRTTGVYCRPGCPARLPLRANVRFFADGAQARAQGFRPCLRCRPDDASPGQRQVEIVVAACRAIEAAEVAPSLADLARTSKLSPHHFHRLFRSVTGVTPKAYAMARRAERLRGLLPQARSVTDAVYDAGFDSPAPFYEASRRLLGMPPARFRQGGRAESIRHAFGQCSLGRVLVAATDAGLCAVLIGDDDTTLLADLARRFPHAERAPAPPAFASRVADVVRLIEAPDRPVDLPLDIRGTTFQQKVWQALRETPAGSTVSYTELAERIGSPGAVRAVAGACAANPLAVIVPCHRAVRRDGALSGYRWGVDRKRALLKREADSGSA